MQLRKYIPTCIVLGVIIWYCVVSFIFWEANLGIVFAQQTVGNRVGTVFITCIFIIVYSVLCGIIYSANSLS